MNVCLLAENDCYRQGKTIVPQGIMVHSTGANNPWLRRYVGPDDGLLGENQYGNHWNRPGLAACVHAFIGRRADGTVDTYQTLPWNYRGWHCGRSGNDTHISFEICEDGLADEDYFRQTYQAAVDLAANLCRLYGLDPLAAGVVVDHAEGSALGIASSHSDIGHWWRRFGVQMEDFRQAVAQAMETPAPYQVRKSWPDKASQLGAYASLALAKAACLPGYTVFDSGGQAVYSPGEEEITMADIQAAVDAAMTAWQAAQTYQTLEDVPEWGRPAVEKLVAAGVLLGDETGLNLSRDMVRMLVILDRLQSN